MKNEELSFVTVIVTYGAVTRFNGVERTIKSVIDAGTRKIFLLDNGCDYSLSEKINNSFRDINIDLKRFDKNQGSAIGFSEGIKMAMSDVDLPLGTYILILDDDVLLDKDFVGKFISTEKNLIIPAKHIWSLLREGRDKTFTTRYDRNSYYYYNSIAGFSIFRKKSKSFTARDTNISHPYFIPWAGTLIRREDLMNIQLPQNNFFVYEDDAELSLNIRNKGYEIYRSKELILRESSKSWFEDDVMQKSGYKLFYQSSLPEGRFLYKIRNNVFLVQDRLVTNKSFFYINIVVFIIAGFLRYGRLNRNGFLKLRQLCSAILDGLHGILGENDNWNL